MSGPKRAGRFGAVSGDDGSVFEKVLSRVHFLITYDVPGTVLLSGTQS